MKGKAEDNERKYSPLRYFHEKPRYFVFLWASLEQISKILTSNGRRDNESGGGVRGRGALRMQHEARTIVSVNPNFAFILLHRTLVFQFQVVAKMILMYYFYEFFCVCFVFVSFLIVNLTAQRCWSSIRDKLSIRVCCVYFWFFFPECKISETYKLNVLYSGYSCLYESFLRKFINSMAKKTHRIAQRHNHSICGCYCFMSNVVFFHCETIRTVWCSCQSSKSGRCKHSFCFVLFKEEFVRINEFRRCEMPKFGRQLCYKWGVDNLVC